MELPVYPCLSFNTVGNEFCEMKRNRQGMLVFKRRWRTTNTVVRGSRIWIERGNVWHSAEEGRLVVMMAARVSKYGRIMNGGNYAFAPGVCEA